MSGRPRMRTPEDDLLFEQEAERRALRLPESRRICTKILAESSGLSIGWVAHIISQKRRAIEARNYLNSENSGAVAASTQSVQSPQLQANG